VKECAFAEAFYAAEPGSNAHGLRKSRRRESRQTVIRVPTAGSR